MTSPSSARDLLVRAARLDGPADVDVGHAGATRDRNAVHEPDRGVAGRSVAPQDVRLAVAVEVAGLLHRPVGRHGPEPGALQIGRAVHQPYPKAAVAVTPHQIGLAVAVEV